MTNKKYTVLAGTQNQHKILEIIDFLNLEKIEIKTLNDYKNIPEIEENGHTFKDNAYIKAKAYYELVNIPVFADDSGLRVDALNGEPGVYSARFAGDDVSYLDNNTLLLEKMKDVTQNQRSAEFVSTICYLDKNGAHYFTGITNGEITNDFRGDQGFGYDPIFYLPESGKTYAELSMEEKNRISHRGKALAQLKIFLEKKFQ